MHLKITLFLILIFSETMLAQSYSGPESVEFDVSNNRWLVANTQSHQVLARDSAGNLSVFVSGLGSGPYGIEIAGDTLFCCSGSNVKGYLLSNGSQVFNVNLGATFLNGITHDNSGNLYVTDFSAKTIYKLNIASMSDTLIANNLVQSPNGIIFDEVNNRCVFVNWGSNAPIKAIDLQTFNVSVLVNTSLGSCDGIARDGHGRYYVSNWSNQSIVQFDSAFASPPVTIASMLNNPADIFYNIISDTLAIPNAGNNTVVFLGFSTVSVTEYDNHLDAALFPNPAKNKSFLKINLVSSQKVSMEIFSIQGQLFIKQAYEGREGINSFPVFPELLNISSGMYIVRVQTGSITRNFRLLID